MLWIFVTSVTYRIPDLALWRMCEQVNSETVFVY